MSMPPNPDGSASPDAQPVRAEPSRRARESTQAWRHRCGTYFDEGTRRCPGCSRPLVQPIPESLVQTCEQFEQWVGLDQRRISLLGLVAVSYLAGWDAALAALDEPDAPPLEDPASDPVSAGSEAPGMSMPTRSDGAQPFTADQLEWIFHESLRTADMRGVEAALTVMAGVDPRRAVELYEATKTALAIAQLLRGGGS